MGRTAETSLPSVREAVDGLVFVRGDVLRGRVASALLEGLDRFVPAPPCVRAELVRELPDGGAFSVRWELDADEPRGVLVPWDESDDGFDDAVSSAECVDAIHEPSQITQVRLPRALCVPHAAQSQPRAGVSGRPGLLRARGLDSSQTRQVFLLRVLCVPQASHCQVGFAAMFTSALVLSASLRCLVFSPGGLRRPL